MEVQIEPHKNSSIVVVGIVENKEQSVQVVERNANLETNGELNDATQGASLGSPKCTHKGSTIASIIFQK
jgi:hypothetical protein